ncbi:twin-arginine translocase TatA/TatE family subunit [Mycetocola reblochoni]|uniref:Sec-independent protein translocase protein TatA n=2 Tax=Mycetocola reblochoni TaxID=331618 RepID=A0A1R4J6M1_9MICO|nr:twin-arginine translocase TatA/TatE family subunit [Mycetocola reblochoni]RLP69591.1 twin-arginine translocase TatA/TatE family subunit [Mycetocola reblochoni]SJN27455.1 Twin-arginine translocation protein TatA [Mycetocola reblochoni REB411]
MFSNLGGPHLIIILFIIILLFGAPKLPALARSLGQSMKIFRSEVSTKNGAASGTDAADGTTSTPAAPTENTAPGPTATSDTTGGDTRPSA